MGGYSEEYLIGDKIDVAGILEVNHFGGQENGKNETQKNGR